ncbi:MAG: ATP-binding protein, partial [Gemmatimonadaceae bacterium]
MTTRDLVRRFRRTRLGVRLAVLSAVLAAAVIGGTFVALSVQVRRSTRQLFADELSRSQRTLVALQTENRRRLVVTASLLAESPNLRSAIATYRVEQNSGRATRSDLTNTVQRELERLGRDLNAGALLATDERGRVFAGYVRGGGTIQQGFELATLPAVRNALDPAVVSSQSETYLSGLEVGDAYYGVGAAPVILDGYTIGALVFGQRVDSTLVSMLRASFDGDVVASAGSHVIAASLPARAASDVVTSNVGARSMKLGDQEYLAAVIPMGRTQLGTELHLTLLQPLTPTVNALAAQLRRDFLFYGALAILLAALGAIALSRSLLEPLRAFIAIMRAGAEGKTVERGFDAENASQEIRTLDASYTRLMEALGRERTALQRRGAELAAANEVLTDEIRGRERIERALRESEAQLRQSQKLEAIGTLAGGIAHDFNNLLTVISGFTQLAIGRLGKSHPVATDLTEVNDAATRAASLTHQLLAFSRKQVLQPRVIDLDDTVRSMQEMLRRLIGSHIELRVAHDGESSRIKADPSQLEQVLLNLVVNARDAMLEGGKVTISTRHQTDSSGARWVALRVADTGVGMSKDVRERVFEPFYTTKEVGKGTGLGLSTVYGVVAQSGGTIEVDSILGKGSTFTVRFPAVSESAAAAEHADAGDLPVGTETILVVDDDDAIRRLAEQALTSFGYTVVVARNGVEALTIARTMPRLDVLVTDIVMPQLSGQQLAERIMAKFPAPCVIYMTGWVNDATMELELDTDVTLLRKPFTP